MSKTKAVETSKKLVEDMKAVVDKIETEKYTHEDLRRAVVDLGKFVLEMQVYMLGIWSDDRDAMESHLVSEVVETFKGIRKQLDKDFETAERNFVRIGQELEEFEHRVSKCEAGVGISVLQANAMKAGLVKNGLLGKKSIQEGFKSIPESITESLRDILHMNKKEWRSVLRQARDAV